MNALVSITFRLDLPESVVERIAGPDDGSDGYSEAAGALIEAAIKDDPSGFMEYVGDEPDVEVTT